MENEHGNDSLRGGEPSGGDDLYRTILALAGNGEDVPEAEPNGTEPGAGGGAMPDSGAEGTVTIDLDGEAREVGLDALIESYRRQAETERKAQELADRQGALQREWSARQARNFASMPIGELFQVDPHAAVGRIRSDLDALDGEIEAAVQKDDTAAVVKLQHKRNGLERIGHTAMQLIEETAILDEEIRTAIPEFDAKAPKIAEFVAGLLPEEPLTARELDLLTNPMSLGRTAVKVVKLINGLYDRVQGAKASAEAKVSKAPPQPLHRAGTGYPAPGRPAHVHTLKDRAVRSGDLEDWAVFIGAQTQRPEPTLD